MLTLIPCILGSVSITDQRSQYVSDRYQQLLSDNGFICSMIRKGNCWDNAAAESFFHTLKTELIHHEDASGRRKKRIGQFLSISKRFITVRERTRL